MRDAQDNLDRERIKKLAHDVMLPIAANFQHGPTSQDRVFEALNALAVGAAVVIAGTEGAERAWAFFDKAVEQNVVAIRSEV